MGANASQQEPPTDKSRRTDTAQAAFLLDFLLKMPKIYYTIFINRNPE
jgi:hypothetical protein